MTQTTIEERLKSLVGVVTKVAGGPHFVELREMLRPCLLLGPYENPAVAAADADSLRNYLAALWEEARKAN